MVALLPVLPDIARAANIDTIPAVVSFLAVVAAVQRIMAMQSVNRWLTLYLGIGATPIEGLNTTNDHDQ